MTFYRDFGEETVDFTRPQRVYARLDTIEPDPLVSEEQGLVFFDAIDADFVDIKDLSRKDLAEETLDRAVSILEVQGDAYAQILSTQKVSGDATWFEFVFNQGGTDRKSVV